MGHQHGCLTSIQDALGKAIVGVEKFDSGLSHVQEHCCIFGKHLSLPQDLQGAALRELIQCQGSWCECFRAVGQNSRVMGLCPVGGWQADNGKERQVPGHRWVRLGVHREQSPRQRGKRGPGQHGVCGLDLEHL